MLGAQLFFYFTNIPGNAQWDTSNIQTSARVKITIQSLKLTVIIQVLKLIASVSIVLL